MLRFFVLGSGSSGNALLVESGLTRILVDCGFSGVELRRRMEAVGAGSPDAITALISTHCHGDHVAGVSVVAKRHGVPVYVTPGTERWFGNRRKFETVRFTPGEAFTVGEFTVRTIPLSHDAPDTVALRLETAGSAVGVCTDLGVVTPEVEAGLRGVETLFIESNHDVEMLVNGPYPARLKKRILGRWGHISNEQSSELLGKLIPAGARQIVLAHLSETNNTPARALEAMAGLRRTYEHVRWAVAPQHVPAAYACDLEVVRTTTAQMELL